MLYHVKFDLLPGAGVGAAVWRDGPETWTGWKEPGLPGGTPLVIVPHLEALLRNERQTAQDLLGALVCAEFFRVRYLNPSYPMHVHVTVTDATCRLQETKP